MATLRELKGRIGSVASSEKITGAMKMISSAKMHKAEADLRRLQPYRKCITDIIGNLLDTDAQFSSPLMEPRDEVRRMAIVAFGSDDGLCGAYNANLAKYLVEYIEGLRASGIACTIDLVPVGTKMAKQAARLAKTIDGLGLALPDTANVNSKSSADQATQFATTLRQQYLDQQYDRIDLVYMNFITISRQRPCGQQLLPIAANAFADAEHTATMKPYIFEPDAESIFNTVLPMYMLSVMQDVFVENRVSEQAARIMAMQSANDNAKKLLEQLRLEYNKLRQQSITNELLDIVGGQRRD